MFGYIFLCFRLNKIRTDRHYWIAIMLLHIIKLHKRDVILQWAGPTEVFELVMNVTKMFYKRMMEVSEMEAYHVSIPSPLETQKSKVGRRKAVVEDDVFEVEVKCCLVSSVCLGSGHQSAPQFITVIRKWTRCKDNVFQFQTNTF